MRTLAIDGRKFAGGNKSTTKEILLIFPVEQNDLHGQILILPQEHVHLWMLSAFSFCGRLIVMTATRPRRSTKRVSYDAISFSKSSEE